LSQHCREQVLDSKGSRCLLRPAKSDVDVLGAVGGCGDEGEVDGGLSQSGQLNLGLLRSLGQPLHTAKAMG
jgi:hypothetical protein